MSLFSIQGRKHTTYYDHLMSSASSKTPARERLIKEQKTTQLSTHLSTDSVNSTCGESRSVYKSINRTYVIPGLSKSGGPPTPAGTPTPTRGRLTLQRRKTNNTNNTKQNGRTQTNKALIFMFFFNPNNISTRPSSLIGFTQRFSIFLAF